MTETHLKEEYQVNLETQIMHMEKIDEIREKLLKNGNTVIKEFTDSIRINEHRFAIQDLQERNRLIDTYLTELWKKRKKLSSYKKKSKN